MIGTCNAAQCSELMMPQPTLTHTVNTAQAVDQRAVCLYIYYNVKAQLINPDHQTESRKTTPDPAEKSISKSILLHWPEESAGAGMTRQSVLAQSIVNQRHSISQVSVQL